MTKKVNLTVELLPVGGRPGVKIDPEFLVTADEYSLEKELDTIATGQVKFDSRKNKKELVIEVPIYQQLLNELIEARQE